MNCKQELRRIPSVIGFKEKIERKKKVNLAMLNFSRGKRKFTMKFLSFPLISGFSLSSRFFSLSCPLFCGITALSVGHCAILSSGTVIEGKLSILVAFSMLVVLHSICKCRVQFHI